MHDLVFNTNCDGDDPPGYCYTMWCWVPETCGVDVHKYKR